MSGGWVEGRSSYVIIGESVVFSHEWLEASSVSSPTSRVYFNEEDKTSTVMPSGSNTVSGTIQTAPPLVPSAEHANGKYVVEFQALVDGNTEIRKLQLDVIASGKRF
jgi:hypothetical protein